MGMRRKKVLFFIGGPVPTDDEREAAAKYDGSGFQLCYRNARHVHPDEACEDFALLDGCIPANYQAIADAMPDEDAAEPPKAEGDDAGGAEGAQGGPLKPQGAAGADDGKPPAETKPKAPKADASKGWKPNA